MRTGAAADHRGFFHETAFYASDEEFLSVVVPFLRDGVAAGEPTLAVFASPQARLVRDAMGADCGVTFIAGDAHYQRPATAIKQYREMLAAHVAAGAAQIRVAGDVPHPGVGVPWEWWARYEAAVNHAYDDFPMWGLCPYDTRTAPDEVLDFVRRTHAHIATPLGHTANHAFQDPFAVLAAGVTPWRDPLEDTPPAIELGGPTTAQARGAALALQAAAGLSAYDLGALLLAISETVTNAVLHGQPPVLLRLWAAPGRIVVTVTDHGPGPADPLVGLVHGASPGGWGLWLAHQVCAYVSLQRDPDGFTVRLLGGQLPG
ncbi:anti-sigma factor RsbA family regulatory protein [Catellatospora chokoriensis]|uniref:Anti-sigma regulatory factor n=1 Tax=Catellatospora chokoriensis TaxID=310353 RepID=A0A8J3KB11_9ACTN|nr:anti-sigma factor RsbA family regulatory protein [Catellatospora chokoriensis]GIF93378.1 anti-sigma regulatory factor [Catellatospora chokoriensis]